MPARVLVALNGLKKKKRAEANDPDSLKTMNVFKRSSFYKKQVFEIKSSKRHTLPARVLVALRQ